MAKKTVPGENGQQDEFIERSELQAFLTWTLKYFGYYFMFKNLDTDNDDRLRVNDFVAGLLQLRQWGADLKDTKDAKKWFYKYDENKGGVILMDEWVQFAAEHALDIEKNAIIIEINKKPRQVYKRHEFMKAGAKRPSQVDPTMKSKSPNDAKKLLDKEIHEIIMKNKQLMATGEKERKMINKDTKKSPRNVN